MPQSESESCRTLWVCWEKPRVPVPANAALLSFAPPEVEEELAKERPLERGREISQEVKPAARRAYLELVAHLGITECRGRTFRRRLENANGASAWWYHPVASRDCESDPTFNRIIAILTIGAVAEDLHVTDLITVGAPPEVVAALKSRFRVTPIQTEARRLGLYFLKALARRMFDALRQCAFVLRPVRLPDARADVFLSAFWDWSFDLNDDGTVRDRYFRDLPREIERRHIGRVGSLVWIDSTRKVSLSRARSIANRNDTGSPIVCLQSLLRLTDIMRAYSNVGPFLRFLRFRRELAATTRGGEDDFSPLFMPQLAFGFLNESLPHAYLVALATERAHRRYRPKAFVSFLEHFPHARAAYRGVADAATDTRCFAVQHASYNSDKMFLSLEPVIEFAGQPDGCKVPRPDFACAMGELGRELFLACGYREDQVLMTGSPRYDSDRAALSPTTDRESGTIELLMVSTLNLILELDMIKAVVAAAVQVPGLRLRFRNHPLRRIEELSGFEDYRRDVEITSGSLESDLASAHLILFTYSTVAEKAFVAGKPVWQWLPLGFDGSALAEVVPIPRFGSVHRLREALMQFAADRQAFVPTPQLRELASRRLFHNGEGGAASRIADAMSRILAEHRRQSADVERRFEASVPV